MPTSMTVTPERLRTNAWGRYYVSSDCDGCGVCALYAPANFAGTLDRSHFAVLHQPLGYEEEKAVQAALRGCPLRCIHDDGGLD
jgi:ferredoxin